MNMQASSATSYGIEGDESRIGYSELKSTSFNRKGQFFIFLIL